MMAQYKCTHIAAQGPNISAVILKSYRNGKIAGMTSMGSRVRALRVSRQLTQVQLAARIKADGKSISQSALSQIEKGQTQSLSGEVLAGLCRELTTTPDFVLFGAGTEDSFEAAMQIAEVTAIMHKLPTQARDALVRDARLLGRATLPPGASLEQIGAVTPGDRRHGERRHVDTPTNLVHLSRHLGNDDNDAAEEGQA